jgi:hypothetical protein
MYFLGFLAEFTSRTHFIIGQKNWEKAEDYIFAWLNEKGL